jgi:hypothetical protein
VFKSIEGQLNYWTVVEIKDAASYQKGHKGLLKAKYRPVGFLFF